MKMFSHSHLSYIFSITVTFTLSILIGCGSGSYTAPPTQTQDKVAISSQPTDQTVPIGKSATFTVSTTGTTPITYQWYKNNVLIDGATSATYTTQNITALSNGNSDENGSIYTVTASNSVNSVTSNPAILIVGSTARSPNPSDLRFQQVDAPSLDNQGLAGGSIDVLGNSDTSFNNTSGTPIFLSNPACGSSSPRSCTWTAVTTPLPPGQSGLTAYYAGGNYTSLASDLSGQGQFPSIVAPNAVITSLDLQPASNAYGASWMQTTQTKYAFDMRREVVSLNSVSATVMQDAAESRVVTAVSFDDSIGMVDLFSYGWQGDTQTTYDTDVSYIASPDELEAAATSLASNGYILTAFGGNINDGYLLIGTKVHGDTTPRPIYVIDQSSPQANPGAFAGYAYVASVSWNPTGAAEQYFSVVLEK